MLAERHDLRYALGREEEEAEELYLFLGKYLKIDRKKKEAEELDRHERAADRLAACVPWLRRLPADAPT